MQQNEKVRNKKKSPPWSRPWDWRCPFGLRGRSLPSSYSIRCTGTGWGDPSHRPWHPSLQKVNARGKDDDGWRRRTASATETIEKRNRRRLKKKRIIYTSFFTENSVASLSKAPPKNLNFHCLVSTHPYIHLQYRYLMPHLLRAQIKATNHLTNEDYCLWVFLLGRKKHSTQC